MPGQQGTFLFNPNDFKGIKKNLVALRVLRKLRSLSCFLRSSLLLMAALLSASVMARMLAITATSNPIATAIYQGQKEFINHPVTQATIIYRSRKSRQAPRFSRQRK